MAEFHRNNNATRTNIKGDGSRSATEEKVIVTMSLGDGTTTTTTNPPPSVELQWASTTTTTTAPSSNNTPRRPTLHSNGHLQKKAVSFHHPPHHVPKGDDKDSASAAAAVVSPPPRRMPRKSRSVPRLDLSSGRLLRDNDDDEVDFQDRSDHRHNTTPTFLSPLSTVVPAGERRQQRRRRPWAAVRKAVVGKHCRPNDNHDSDATPKVVPPTTRRRDTNNNNHHDDEDDDEDDDAIGATTVVPNNNATSSQSFPPTTTTTTHTHTHTTTVVPHYRIRSRQRAPESSTSWFHQHTESVAHAISRYVTWTYRSSFYVTILSSYICFMAIMMLFAATIYVSGVTQPHCIYTGDQEQFSGHVMDAIHLSWTTLAAVGYGVVGPEIPDTNRRCVVINLLMAFESFVGVLFGGFASAVIIGKMTRFLSMAHVVFSDKICIKFGTAAVLDADDDDDDVTNVELTDPTTGDDDDDRVSPTAADSQHPFPVLEFRMINLLSKERGGEILNAHVTVVASVLFNDCESKRHVESLQVRDTVSYPSNLMNMATETTSNLVQMATETTTQAAKMVGTVGTMAVTSTAKLTGAALFCAKKLTVGNNGKSTFQQVVHQAQSARPDQIPATTTHDSSPVQRQMDLMLQKPKQNMRTQIFVDEGNSTLAPPRTYHKLQVETDRHPYFKRVWNIRHVLDEHSPLLSNPARALIRSNSGQWPVHLSNAASIRQYLCFNDIIISFSGTSNAHGRTVYAQKVYTFSNICIGYSFANVLALENYRVVVDTHMIHEIVEQIGGGAEPLPESDPDDGKTLLRRAKSMVNRKVGTR